MVWSVTAGRRARRAPPSLRQLRCPSSVPVGRRTSPAARHGCDDGLRTVQPRRSAARVAATSGAVAPCDAGHSRRRCTRDQPWPTARGPQQATKKGYTGGGGGCGGCGGGGRCDCGGGCG